MGKVGLAALMLAATGAAGADGTQTDVAGWIRARAADWESSFKAPVAPSGPQLWRERPEDQTLPGFVPPTSLAPLIRAVRSGVVNIRTVNGSADSPLGPTGSGPGRSLGSGFIISADGHVVTNNHVVERARKIQVRLADGREFSADVVGRDPATDVALLQLLGVGKERLPVTWLGDSDGLEVGDWVVAIGNPFGLAHSVAHGMISAKERIIGVGVFDDFIQTDALINPGNSGGPLFNMRGEVVGVTTAIATQAQGIGFSVPINMVKDLLPNLRKNGRLESGWLGVDIIDFQGVAEGAPHALVVQNVFAGSPAASAGLKPGDRIVAVNDHAVGVYQQLLRRVAILAPGTELRLTVQRDDGPHQLKVRLGRRPSAGAQREILRAGMVDPLGVVLEDLTPQVATTLGYAPGSGVLVAGVLPRSPADAAGLREGDLLVELNRARVKDVAGVRRVLEHAERGRAVLLRVQRGDLQQYVAVEPR
ncbi:MAG: trypsin-like peptidase domain-containing protein [Myxococcaceae bacterium]|nr:trypsin-like peptidase domain-containing protein [Myxococcaceae bacterium]MCI0670101.1 trypsin-like peptidase domain-containing protein [Myxococcaceae bacterium]